MLIVVDFDQRAYKNENATENATHVEWKCGLIEPYKHKQSRKTNRDLYRIQETDNEEKDCWNETAQVSLVKRGKRHRRRWEKLQNQRQGRCRERIEILWNWRQDWNIWTHECEREGRRRCFFNVSVRGNFSRWWWQRIFVQRRRWKANVQIAADLCDGSRFRLDCEQVARKVRADLFSYLLGGLLRTIWLTILWILENTRVNPQKHTSYKNGLSCRSIFPFIQFKERQWNTMHLTQPI